MDLDSRVRGSDIGVLLKHLLTIFRMFTKSFTRAVNRYFHLPKERVILLCGVISLLAFAAERALTPAGGEPRRSELAAARLMERAIGVLREEYTSRGLQFDDAVDPNHTTLVGPEYTDITTTLGDLEAKRTSTNPNMAGVIVQLLQQAGVKAGDTIAVGASGSFPAGLVATLAATEAMSVHPVVIISLGSSTFGATRSDFTLLDMYEVLLREDIANVPPVAISLGGARDVGRGYESAVRDQLVSRIRKVGIPFLYEPDLPRNVAQRMALYFGYAFSRKIAAFVNIGGSYAELGTSPLVLKLEAGLNTRAVIPAAKETHGVVFEMLEHHIPVIHLLHIKSLAIKYGLPWDPIPLPKAAADGEPRARSESRAGTGIIAAVYFSLLALLFILHRKAFFPRLL
jgi:poly-gamma-glutamate system protein